MTPELKRQLHNANMAVLAFTLLMSLICAIPMLFIVGGFAYENDPEGFYEFLGMVAPPSLDVRLTTEAAASVTDLGISPEDLAYSIAAVQWVHEDFGVQLDLGMLLAIRQGESHGGTSMGTCKGTEAFYTNVNLNHEQEKAAVDWFLNHWKETDIRAQDSLAKDYVFSDYSDYFAHCSASEMGPDGLLPTTALKICQVGLMKSDDPIISSCNFWDFRVSTYAKAYWLYLIGYNPLKDRATNFDELWGWNRNVEYRNFLLDKAASYNELLSNSDLGIDSIEEYSVFNSSPNEGIKTFIAEALVALDILPDEMAVTFGSQQWDQMPVQGGMAVMGRGWGVKDVYVGAAGYHQGLDFACSYGDPIYAVADGQVVDPANYAYKNDPFGWGLALWIDHGGVFSFYGHLSSLNIDYGDVVKKGDVIAFCGSTGNSTGAHLHFGVSTAHPDTFTAWYMDSPTGWVNPTDYLKQWVEVNK